MKSAVIIPARMASKRFPNKPMAKIDGIPMIERVWRQGMNSKIGDVYVACCENEVFDLITSKGGKAIMTNPNHASGTDRIFEAFNTLENKDDYESIINLQGDMPLIDPKILECVNEPLMHGYEIGTIATDIVKKEEENSNITKVLINWNKTNSVGESIDFYKESKKQLENIYQHVGVYSFKPYALYNFVSMKPSKSEIERKLEQLRAIDAGVKIGITYVENIPISVDTLEDLMLIEKIIKNNNETDT
jgi:CMP-2-keto-3-deoxyoctulosonic acid synthetase